MVYPRDSMSRRCNPEGRMRLEDKALPPASGVGVVPNGTDIGVNGCAGGGWSIGRFGTGTPGPPPGTPGIPPPPGTPGISSDVDGMFGMLNPGRLGAGGRAGASGSPV